MEKSLQKVAKAIQNSISEANKIAIGIHSSPDGDCLGAGLALGKYLENNSKNVDYFTPDEVDSGYQFIHGVRNFSTRGFHPSEYDLIIIVDTSGYDRSILKEYKPGSLNTPYIIIDHHHDNDFQHMQHKLVDDNKSSTCEILYDCFEVWGEINSITESIATALLLGIITDTGRFAWGVNPENALITAGKLMEKGANKDFLIQNIYQNKKLEHIRYYSNILERTQYTESRNTLRTYNIQSELSAYDFDEDALKGVYEIVQSVRHKGALVIFKVVDEEEPSAIKISFRTQSETLDVSAIARIFGGGGHKKAAGAKVIMQSDYMQQIKDMLEKIDAKIVELEKLEKGD